MASGESFDDMIHRVQTRRVSNGQRGSRPGSSPAGDSAMPPFQKASASAPTSAASTGSYRDTPVSPAVAKGGRGKSDGKPFGKKSSSKFGFSKGGGFAGGKR